MFLMRKPDGATLLAQIPDGKAGIRETLRVMSRIVKDWKKEPLIRDKAISLAASVPGKNFTGEAREIFLWVRDNIRYINDVTDIETVSTPDYTLFNSAGDCDDQSVLLASLLESIGHPTRFVAIGFEPNTYEHVFVQTKIGNRWYSMDPTEEQEFGWQAPDFTEWMYEHN